MTVCNASEWLTVRETAQQLGNVSTKLIYKLFHAGELEGVQVGSAVRIRAASVAAYLDAHSNKKVVLAADAEQETSAAMPGRRRRKGRIDDFTSYHLAEMDRIEERERCRKQQRTKRS